ncbi:hypothetical protein NY2A_b689R [Paramecium bursaria Chlorella virus NY2A]|uniref:Uncharacterized protein b689R n=1 Tax=Paramecium bursaria Chlorella virus NY2A TaxID=46021 RepID=A7IXL4_PBCVN|nr:hypothetical protein NY2A_b689R [Paramecium bursaria Chlorella virus NY2A]YP_001498706.1 hypothetical protein AR158_C625R [Paramecium bursaria Chlorella virus AR158]ABT15088.1 hypothetical protein NY2A_b689R [Paramecium bursaria Chlorella virus NY2A]ABU44170.1 hypothetical protein AR158_C625R [Paramecium bursaria Chlorella virus AR158]
MHPSLVTSGLVVSVCILVDFQAQNDIRSDDDSVDERVGLRCFYTSIVDAIFSLRHVDVMLLEEAEECVLVFLPGKSPRFVRVTREAILFSV